MIRVRHFVLRSVQARLLVLHSVRLRYLARRIALRLEIRGQGGGALLVRRPGQLHLELY